jgi:hypothetical protein
LDIKKHGFAIRIYGRCKCPAMALTGSLLQPQKLCLQGLVDEYTIGMVCKGILVDSFIA